MSSLATIYLDKFLKRYRKHFRINLDDRSVRNKIKRGQKSLSAVVIVYIKQIDVDCLFISNWQLAVLKEEICGQPSIAPVVKVIFLYDTAV